jgi:hypothetical protein
MSREHDWKYSSGEPGDSTYRFCGQCCMRQWTVDPGDWSNPGYVLWRTEDHGRWLDAPVPECPDAAPPETEWSRVEGEHPRWEIKNPKGDGHDYLCTDAVIRTYGRKHTEWLLRDLPPLPDKAWEAGR